MAITIRLITHFDVSLSCLRCYNGAKVLRIAVLNLLLHVLPELVVGSTTASVPGTEKKEEKSQFILFDYYMYMYYNFLTVVGEGEGVKTGIENVFCSIMKTPINALFFHFERFLNQSSEKKISDQHGNHNTGSLKFNFIKHIKVSFSLSDINISSKCVSIVFMTLQGTKKTCSV